MTRHGWVWAVAGLGMLALGGCRVATLGLGEQSVASGDGLGLKFGLSGKLVAVTMDNKELPAQFTRVLAPGGFYVRDPGSTARQEMLGSVEKADHSLVISGSPGGLKLRAVIDAQPDRIEIRGRLTNPAGNDRGVVVGLSLPVNAAGWLFGRSILTREAISGGGTYAEWTCADSDWDGRQINRGMFTPVYNEMVGLAMGACPEHPEIFRVSYAQGHGLTMEIDLGLSPIPQKFPNTATFKFVIFRFDPARGYRSALAKYFRMFPEDHRARSNRYGNWIASANLNKINAKAADYAVVFDSHGARYFKEAAEQGVEAFEYSRGHYDVIPIYAGNARRPIPPADLIRRAVQFTWAAQANQKQEAWKRDPSPATQADMGRNCHTWGPDGQMQTWTVEGPYNYEKRLFPDGYMAADIPMNPDPELPAPNQAQRVLNWNFGAPLTDARAGGFKLAGHHIDGWADFAGRFLENHRPSHWRYVDVPLTFSYRTNRPVQYHAFMWQELARPLSEFLHSQKMLLFVNDRPWRASVMFDQGLIDVHGGSERPERNIDYMAFFRALVGDKPISGTGIGQAADDPNRNYSPRELAQFERDLNILLPYCWFPGGFGPRELWRKYCLPMQEMAAAGWEPLTAAVVVHPDLLVERYGGADDAKVFYIVHNRSEKPLGYEMAIDLAAINADPKAAAITERLSGKPPEAVIVEQSLVLRSRVGGRGSNVFQVTRTGGRLASQPADAQWAIQESPRESSLTQLPRFDAKKSASPQFAATMKRLNLRPRTAQVFLNAYELEKRELAAAVAFHIEREKPADLNAAAVELANWFGPRFDSIYESTLPAPKMMEWTAMRANYKDASAWRMNASAAPRNGALDVRIWDPLLEKPQW